MNEAQAIGDVVDAALTARVAEPHAGEAADGHSHETACLNCGTPLVGSHCHACGQAAHVHRTLGAFFHDLLHGVFHFEGKIWHTLPLLAWKPGELTRRYIDGQRARFVSPLALFLFTVFLAFAVYHQTAGEAAFEPDVQVTDGKGQAQGEKAIEARIAKLEADRRDLRARGQGTDAIDGQLEGQHAALEIVREVKASGSNENGKVSDIAAIDQAVKKFRKNPGLTAYKAQNYAYKYSWALIPISVPFLWLLFPFSRRFHLYDHTVFVTYSLSFMTILAVAAMLLGAVGAPGIAALVTLVPPLHMYRQLRGAYGVSRLGGILRTMALSVFAFIALMFFVILIAAETGA
ncbi:DUF3667 domain-containing protein [Novosphingobium sp. KCTC 2891]|uniref:DUF3667 domain-containing protein n=1 Tax=Novosphingobium sp. KCTC 2891 TaxID=2989730 RepID=UPI002223C65B|nr:DUF3667 domain-containing protein [Novosphingobium sp. KCTC 2891]MCW1382304.1 DUF3667 domain-containing protein [Novosphingobium sp. KCTC 2891]